MKKIIVASDSFKGCMSSSEIGERIAVTARKLFPEVEVTVLPISDGGEGLVEAVVKNSGFLRQEGTFCDPQRQPLTAAWVRRGAEAVIELAQCSGLGLCHPRNPALATTYGTGLQIKAALDAGCQTIYLGLGGSGTHEGGCGIAAALGVRFLHQGKTFLPTGATLDQIEALDLSDCELFNSGARLICLCDVTNPLFGTNGAAQVFARQKGADEALIAQLDHNTEQLTRKVETWQNCSLAAQPGLGAAGACGLMLKGVFRCEIRSGLEQLLHWMRLDEQLTHADLIITGEGRIDSQSLQGKVPLGILHHAQTANVPVLAVCGQLGIAKTALLEAGFRDVLVLQKPSMSKQESIRQAPRRLQEEWTAWLKRNQSIDRER